jgi:hypothetical protein
VAFNSYMLMLSSPVQELTWLVNAAGEAAPERSAYSKFWTMNRRSNPRRMR